MKSDAVRGSLVRLLTEPPDLSPLGEANSWTLIREHAANLGVAPLIASIARPYLPDQEQRWCDQILKQNWVRYARALWVLKHVLSLLEDAGVRALSLKGPLLAIRYYSPPFLRKPSVDLDLAVQEEDLERACDTLVAAGYSMATSIPEAKRVSHHVVLSHQDLGRVELHFRLSHGVSGIPVSEFFLRAVQYQLPCGYTAWILSPADEALHLVLHLVQDRFTLLFHFAEVRRVWAAVPQSVREEAVRRAIEYRFVGALILADSAFRYRWKEPLLPSTVALPRTWLQGRLNERLYMAMEKSAGEAHGHPLIKRIRGRWFDLQTTDSPADALRIIQTVTNIAWHNFRRR